MVTFAGFESFNQEFIGIGNNTFLALPFEKRRECPKFGSHIPRIGRV
jgi:hypothetical protein